MKMVVFHEYFPVVKESVTAQRKEQMKDEKLVQEAPSNYEGKSVIRKIIDKLAVESEKDLQLTKERKVKVAIIHNQIEKFDEINYWMDSPQDIDHQLTDIADSKSELSSPKRVHEIQEVEELTPRIDKKKVIRSSRRIPARDVRKTSSSSNVPTSFSFPQVCQQKKTQSVITRPASLSVQEMLIRAKVNRKKSSHVEIPVPVIQLKFEK